MASKIAVVGAGLMGSGIAQVAAAAGHDVVLLDISDAVLQRGLRAVAASLSKMVDKGKLPSDDRDAALDRIAVSTSYDAAGAAEIVVEAVFENVEVKHKVFKALDRVCADNAVLATNTSAIPITRIAAATERPESVIGTHFFSPVPLMALCELVRGLKTADATVQTARAFAESVGKTVIVVNRDVAGFVTTRLIGALVVEAIRLHEAGVASAEDIDTACRLGFGHPMGPLATADLTGLDVLRNATRTIYEETGDHKFFPPEQLTRMVSAGELGRKTGRGFYTYG
jgi:3-hydroxybutyryl-CoA dehydrogenase